MRGRKLLTVVAAALAVPVFSIQAQAADPTRYVAIGGSDNTTCSHDNPCQHIQHAVDIAAPGDRIVIGPGTYVEQVLIGKDLTVEGQGAGATTIKAPDVKILDAGGRTYVVEVGAAATLQMSRLTVAGPGAPGGGNDCGPNSASLDKGIKVTEGATLDLRDATVRDIYDVPDSGCQRGDAISIGTDCFTCTPAAVGHATIEHVLISRYQKNGVAVRGAGSTLTVLPGARHLTPLERPDQIAEELEQLVARSRAPQ